MSLYPSEEYDSTYDIPFEDYYSKGYRGIIFDVDNTLVLHGAPSDERSRTLFERLNAIGYSTCILSNNKELRVKSFADEVDSAYVYKAGKPLTKGYVKAMDIMNTETRNTLFVGDQIFTDIWGANNAGIHSIFVKQLGPDPEIQIVLKRIPEKVVLFFYRNWYKI